MTTNFPNARPRYVRSAFTSNFQGLRIEGDATVAPTRWWNKVWMHLRGWSKIATFRVPTEVARRGYRIGFRLFTGVEKITWYAHYEEAFSLLIGHEAVRIFLLEAEEPSEILLGDDAVSFSRRF